jgi:hypothetical protein
VSHGGKRMGAGRPAGPAWKPAIAAIRASVVDHLQEAIGGANDPLAIALSIAADVKQPVEIRLGACGLAIPVMYPKLSATTVQANHTVTNIHAGELMDRLADKIARMHAPATIEQDPTPPADHSATLPNDQPDHSATLT